MSGVDVEVLVLLVSELLNSVSELLVVVVVELLALRDDARDAGQVRHAVQALHPDVARGGAHPLINAVDIMPNMRNFARGLKMTGVLESRPSVRLFVTNNIMLNALWLTNRIFCL